ncbi:hypothetical protein AAY473_027390 [Plecturocebus cupreus]
MDMKPMVNGNIMVVVMKQRSGQQKSATSYMHVDHHQQELGHFEQHEARDPQEQRLLRPAHGCYPQDQCHPAQPEPVMVKMKWTYPNKSA